MAAGTIILAHNSGGPKLDIVVEHEGEATGFLADDVDSYSSAMKTIFNSGLPDRNKMATNARKSVQKFSHDEFEHNFLYFTEILFHS